MEGEENFNIACINARTKINTIALKDTESYNKKENLQQLKGTINKVQQQIKEITTWMKSRTGE